MRVVQQWIPLPLNNLNRACIWLTPPQFLLFGWRMIAEHSPKFFSVPDYLNVNHYLTITNKIIMMKYGLV